MYIYGSLSTISGKERPKESTSEGKIKKILFRARASIEEVLYQTSSLWPESVIRKLPSLNLDSRRNKGILIPAKLERPEFPRHGYHLI